MTDENRIGGHEVVWTADDEDYCKVVIRVEPGAFKSRRHFFDVMDEMLLEVEDVLAADYRRRTGASL